MHPSISVQIDLRRLRQNIQAIAQRTGVAVIAVVKADAYGLGAREVIPAIDDLVDSYYLLQPREVMDARLHELTTKPFIAAVCDSVDADTLRQHRIRPAVWTSRQAAAWRSCDPVLAVDTGQQRFAAAPDQLAGIVSAGGCREAYTHASQVAQAVRFAELTDPFRFMRRHSAGTSLLDAPEARFDATRPGFAMYRGAVTVSTRLLDARESLGPAGYTGFQVPRHGVIFGGYSDGLSAGVCVVNGVKRRILEIGMQTAFVELGSDDRPGDEVILLGDPLPESDAAAAWRCGAHEALYRLSRCGLRRYHSCNSIE